METPQIIIDYLKTQIKSEVFSEKIPISLRVQLNSKNLLLLKHIIEVRKGIEKHKKNNKRWSNWKNKIISITAKEFSEEVPKNISTPRLRSLFINHNKAMCLISGAKKIQWSPSEWVAKKKFLAEIIFFFVDHSIEQIDGQGYIGGVKNDQ